MNALARDFVLSLPRVMNACWIAILVATGLLGQELPRAMPEYGAFALPDATGTRLIAIGGMPDAAIVRHALCSDGSNVPVRFDGRQLGRNDHGRQVPSRFHQLAGDVFRVVQTKVEVTATCFLVGNGWISGATVVPVNTADHGGACDSRTEEHLARSKGRAIVHCFSIGRFQNDGRVVLAEFAPLGKNALGSVALTDGKRVLSGDYPADSRRDGEDLWRVDDGGALSAEGFRVVFVVRRAERYALGVSWAGTEGRSLEVFVSDNRNAFDRVMADYWYQAPE